NSPPGTGGVAEGRGGKNSSTETTNSQNPKIKIKSLSKEQFTPNPSFTKEGNSNAKPKPNSPPGTGGVAEGRGGKNSSTETTNSQNPKIKIKSLSKEQSTPNPSFTKEGNSNAKSKSNSPPGTGGVAEGRGGHLISSTQNPKIKNLLALEKPRERRKQQLFVIEGKKEIGMALEAGYKIRNLFFCENIISLSELKSLHIEEKFLVSVSREVFDKIAVRENSGGVIAVSEMKAHSLHHVKLSKNPLLLILEGVEKPGNLGAILRTADAAGIDAVIICDPQTDFYNPNVIRSSIGCIFTKQVAAATSEETIQWLKKNNIFILCTYLEASKPYHTIDYSKPSAIVMGTESTGLTKTWTKNADANIIIPMGGKIDSMNVSTAAAVVVFEARRQRGF
ncbi:MAG: RNA methyltransferase, partial [Cyclobacteriaceae bacterium]